MVRQHCRNIRQHVKLNNGMNNKEQYRHGRGGTSSSSPGGNNKKTDRVAIFYLFLGIMAVMATIVAICKVIDWVRTSCEHAEDADGDAV